MASFHSVNYALRPNKNIERKLIFEALHFLGDRIGLSDYHYVGLGSMWFVDFVMAHRILRIKKLTSIEHEAHAARANFNRPYSCIDVRAGDTTSILPEIDWSSRALVWLDYDTGPEGPLLGDIDIVSGSAPVGSIIILTANAHTNRLPKEDMDGNEISKPTAAKQVFGSLIPEQELRRVDASTYSKLLAQAMFAKIGVSLFQAGRKETFFPIFNFWYSDNAPMVTVGGIIVDAEMMTEIRDMRLFDKFDYLSGDRQFRIDVPLLTPKEKRLLDGLLPTVEPLTTVGVRAHSGFDLTPEQLNNYVNFYLLYPIFTEILI